MFNTSLSKGSLISLSSVSDDGKVPLRGSLDSKPPPSPFRPTYAITSNTRTFKESSKVSSLNNGDQEIMNLIISQDSTSTHGVSNRFIFFE